MMSSTFAIPSSSIRLKTGRPTMVETTMGPEGARYRKFIPCYMRFQYWGHPQSLSSYCSFILSQLKDMVGSTDQATN